MVARVALEARNRGVVLSSARIRKQVEQTKEFEQMTAYFIAFGVALGLALARLAASQFEDAYYLFCNGEFRKAFRATMRALTCVALLALVVSPVASFFDSFEVISIEQPSPNASKGLRV